MSKTNKDGISFFSKSKTEASLALVFIVLVAANIARMIHTERVTLYDIGMLIIITGGLLLIASLSIMKHWCTRPQIIAGTVLGIIPAALYPIGMLCILLYAKLNIFLLVFLLVLMIAAWGMLVSSAIKRYRYALESLNKLTKTDIRAKAMNDINAAENSGASNIDERIALAYIAAEKMYSRELMEEYRDELSVHAISKGYGPKYYEDYANNLVLDGKVSP